MCDVCGGELYQRDDDNEEVVHRRLAEYRSQTEPIIEYYRSHNLLLTISAVGKVNEVLERALAALRGE